MPVLVAGGLLSACADSKRGSLVLHYLTTVEVISTGERVEVEHYAMCFDAERGSSTFILSFNEALWVPTSDGGAIAVAPPIIHDCSTFPRRSRLSPQVAYYPDVADLSVALIYGNYMAYASPIAELRFIDFEIGVATRDEMEAWAKDRVDTYEQVGAIPGPFGCVAESGNNIYENPHIFDCNGPRARALNGGEGIGTPHRHTSQYVQVRPYNPIFARALREAYGADPDRDFGDPDVALATGADDELEGRFVCRQPDLEKQFREAEPVRRYGEEEDYFLEPGGAEPYAQILPADNLWYLEAWRDGRISGDGTVLRDAAPPQEATAAGEPVADGAQAPALKAWQLEAGPSFPVADIYPWVDYFPPGWNKEDYNGSYGIIKQVLLRPEFRGFRIDYGHIRDATGLAPPALVYPDRLDTSDDPGFTEMAGFLPYVGTYGITPPELEGLPKNDVMFINHTLGCGEHGRSVIDLAITGRIFPDKVNQEALSEAPGDCHDRLYLPRPRGLPDPRPVHSASTARGPRGHAQRRARGLHVLGPRRARRRQDVQEVEI